MTRISHPAFNDWCNPALQIETLPQRLPPENVLLTALAQAVTRELCTPGPFNLYRLQGVYISLVGIHEAKR